MVQVLTPAVTECLQRTRGRFEEGIPRNLSWNGFTFVLRIRVIRSLCVLGNHLAQTQHFSTALLLLRPNTDVLMWNWKEIPGGEGAQGEGHDWTSHCISMATSLSYQQVLCSFMCMRHLGLGRSGWGAVPTKSPDYGKGTPMVSCTGAGLGAELALACSPSRDVLQVQSCWQ